MIHRHQEPTMSDATIQLAQHRVGPVQLQAPHIEVRHTRGTHGDMWQWIGDGANLISLIVAVRRTRLGSATGVKHHLQAEMDRLERGLDIEHGSEHHTIDARPVPGASAEAAGVVSGVRDGVKTRDTVVVTTDHTYMHLIHIMTPNTTRGISVAEAISSSVEIFPWEGKE